MPKYLNIGFFSTFSPDSFIYFLTVFTSMKFIYASILLVLAFLTLGCLNYISSTRDCGSNMGCFREALEYDCEKTAVTVSQNYGQLRLESFGPMWTDALNDERRMDCRVKVQVVSVNESALPPEALSQLKSANVPPSSISLTDMECSMSYKNFTGIYILKNATVAKAIYPSCHGTLKVLSDQVPAVKELMTK